MKNIKSIFLVLLITLYGCHKANVSRYTINTKLLSAFNYKVGTYWIYRDSLSGNIDSFFVTNNHSGTTSSLDHNGDGFYSEYIVVSISDQRVSPIFIDTPVTFYVETYVENAIYLKYWGEKMHTSELDPLINYPFQTTFSTGHGSPFPYYEIRSVLDTSGNYTFNGNNFSKVALVNHNANGSLINYDDFFYISADLGIIKMRLNHPVDSVYKVWEIVRWHIVK